MAMRAAGSSGKTAWYKNPVVVVPLLAAIIAGVFGLGNTILSKERSSKLVVTLEPTSAPEGQPVMLQVHGQGFTEDKTVELFFGQPGLGAIVQQPEVQDGEFTTTIEVPGDLVPAVYKVRAYGLQSNKETEAIFKVESGS